MNRLLIVCLLLTGQLLLALHAFSQHNDKEIGKIREIFQRINRDTTYQIVRINDAEKILGHATDGGASLTGYFKDDSIYKTIEWVGLSDRVIQTEYYLDRGKLVFVYSLEKQYYYNDSLQALDHSKLLPPFERRYYFKNNKLFHFVPSKKEQRSSGEQESSNLLKRVEVYIALLKKSK